MEGGNWKNKVPGGTSVLQLIPVPLQNVVHDLRTHLPISLLSIQDITPRDFRILSPTAVNHNRTFLRAED